MLRACGEHVAITIQTSDAKLVVSWEGIRCSPRRTSDQEHYRFSIHETRLLPFLCTLVGLTLACLYSSVILQN
jgi:hypothetical protein